MLGHVISCHVILCYAMLCNFIFCYFVLCPDNRVGEITATHYATFTVGCGYYLKAVECKPAVVDYWMLHSD